MRQKWPLFLGIVLLTSGIILKKTTGFSTEALVILLTGVALKVYYIIDRIRSGHYQVGKEMIALAVGLALFLTGLHVKQTAALDFNHWLLMAPGIALKVLFIIVFIKKTRKSTAVEAE